MLLRLAGLQYVSLTAVGFEPTPLRNGALSHRLRPLGQTVMEAWGRHAVWGVGATAAFGARARGSERVLATHPQTASISGKAFAMPWHDGRMEPR